ncbi:MAG: hypothetical protein HY329_17580 [Chloroflexi bacterium]|nr:hypothetical protein [Chloroflexota bacterium]
MAEWTLREAIAAANANVDPANPDTSGAYEYVTATGRDLVGYLRNRFDWLLP